MVNPSLKCMALLIRTMLREFRRRDGNPTDLVLQNQIYGYRDEFQLVIRNDLVQGTTKQIYSLLLQEIISKNGSFIPSRNEKRSLGVKWSISWKNMSLVRGLVGLYFALIGGYLNPRESDQLTDCCVETVLQSRFF